MTAVKFVHGCASDSGLLRRRDGTTSVKRASDQLDSSNEAWNAFEKDKLGHREEVSGDGTEDDSKVKEVDRGRTLEVLPAGGNSVVSNCGAIHRESSNDGEY